MSRVHDALRRAEQLLDTPAGAGLIDDGLNGAGPEEAFDSQALLVPEEMGGVTETPASIDVASLRGGSNGIVQIETKELQVDWRNFLSRCKVIPFHPAPEAHLIDMDRPHEVPGEEFRSLRTRLNHMQSSAGSAYHRRHQRVPGARERPSLPSIWRWPRRNSNRPC